MVGVPRRNILPPSPAENWDNFWRKASAKAQGAWEGMMSGLMAPGNALRGEYNQVEIGPDGSVSQFDPRMVQDASSLAGMVTLGSGAIPRPAGTLDMGFKAYHGSPHDFDKFSMDKIGTGEGAQAYGHGMYFAENPSVAAEYRANLTGMRVSAASRALDGAGGDVDAAMASVKAEIERLRNLPNAGGDAAKRDRFIMLNEEKMSELRALKESGEMSTGRVYEVDIDADHSDFIDWDKPLTEQPKAVIDALGMDVKADKISLPNGERVPPSQLYGRDIWRAFSEGARGMPDEATAALRAKGVKGIRYLDAGSRDTGDGSRNFVVFDDKLISILSKK